MPQSAPVLVRFGTTLFPAKDEEILACEMSTLKVSGWKHHQHIPYKAYLFAYHVMPDLQVCPEEEGDKEEEEGEEEEDDEAEEDEGGDDPEGEEAAPGDKAAPHVLEVNISSHDNVSVLGLKLCTASNALVFAVLNVLSHEFLESNLHFAALCPWATTTICRLAPLICDNALAWCLQMRYDSHDHNLGREGGLGGM